MPGDTRCRVYTFPIVDDIASGRFTLINVRSSLELTNILYIVIFHHVLRRRLARPIQKTLQGSKTPNDYTITQSHRIITFKWLDKSHFRHPRKVPVHPNRSPRPP